MKISFWCGTFCLVMATLAMFIGDSELSFRAIVLMAIMFVHSDVEEMKDILKKNMDGRK